LLGESASSGLTERRKRVEGFFLSWTRKEFPMANDRPIHEIRLGKCKAAIWANPTEHGTRYNVTFLRIYKQDDQWETTSSFGRDDLPLVAKLADQAHTWIYEKLAHERDDAANEKAPASDRRSDRSPRTAATTSRR
jgi:hypothetical protein